MLENKLRYLAAVASYTFVKYTNENLLLFYWVPVSLRLFSNVCLQNGSHISFSDFVFNQSFCWDNLHSGERMCSQSVLQPDSCRFIFLKCSNSCQLTTEYKGKHFWKVIFLMAEILRSLRLINFPNSWEINCDEVNPEWEWLRTPIWL